MPGITLPGSSVAFVKSIRTVIGTSAPPVAIELSVPEVGVTMLSHGVIEPVLLVTVKLTGAWPPWLKRYVVSSTLLAPAGRPVSRLSLVTLMIGPGTTVGRPIARGVLNAASISTWSACRPSLTTLAPCLSQAAGMSA